MSEKKIIGLFGSGQTDICIYVASILQNAGYSVCVLDNSYEQAMQFCIPRPSEELLTITYKNIDYERLVPPDYWQERDYDFLLVDLGVWPPEESLRECGELFLVSDCNIAQLFRYRELMRRVERPMNVILRDVCPEAASASRILDILREENCFVLDTYVLPFSEGDTASRLGMQYRGYRSLSRLSGAFRKMLVRLCRRLAGCGETAIVRGFRRARKGACA